MKHPVKHLRFPEAPVEAVTEFRQVTGQVLWADAMMDATNIAFDLGDQGVDPGQDLRRLCPRTGNEPLINI
jgi:hypothetical protein